MKTKLVESGAFVAETGDKGRLVRIIREGRGSSGTYSRELLREYAHVFSNTLSYVNHPADPDKPWERSFLDIAGAIEGETFYEERDGVGGIYGYFVPNPKYAEDLAFVYDKIGLSIYIEGSGSKSDSGELMVESLNGDDPYRSVDVVVAAGAGGRFEKLEEAFRVREGLEEDPATAQERSTQPGGTQRKEVEPMDVEAKLGELTATVEALVELLTTERENKVQVEDAEKAVADAVAQYDASVAAIEAADLLPSQVASLRAEAKTGKDITADIESAKLIATEARAAVASSGDGVQGRVHESAHDDNDDFTISGWGA